MGGYRLGSDAEVRWTGNSAAEAGSSVPSSKRSRSIWISDLHLGTLSCKAEELLAFLRQHEAENLYLVGDTVDGWVQGPAWYWSPAQGAVVQEIIAWHRRGVQVVLLLGNHDEPSTDLVQALFEPVSIVTELIHRTAEGRRMLVIHGHQFDGSLNPNRLLAKMGNQGYMAALRVDQWYDREYAKAGARDGSLTAYLKVRVKKAVQYLTDFSDRAVFEAARRFKADGVICGHIHRAEQRLIGPIWYINDGDWVKSCTALVEDRQGSLQLVRWGLRQCYSADSEPETPGEGS
jgi:UDP-2,3-diacylglucosamine pyrophosphatase LpxH